MENILSVKLNWIAKYSRLLISISIIFILFKSDLYGQRKFISGYIITSENDTLRGRIKFEDWVTSPVEIKFRMPNASSKIYLASTINGFGIDFDNSVYKSKKVGVLDITMNREYLTKPRLVTKDSLHTFLKELISGKNASLFVYYNSLERPHYFLERSGRLAELYNYSYYMSFNNKTHLLSTEKYREQLRELAEISPKFGDSMPVYQEKYLKRYIKNFNKSFPNPGDIYEAERDGCTFDFDINVGLESWNEVPVVLKRKFTYGVGARLNFPGKFHNRYIKANVFFTPNAWLGFDRLALKRGTLKTYEVSVGSYIGKSMLRPYIGLHHSGVGGGHRMDFLGFQAGVSLDRRINLEIGHFVNFASAFTETTFLTSPRISLHYMIDLSLKRTKLL